MSAEDMPSFEEIPSPYTIRPLPLPPRPSTAISGGFSPRDRSRGFDGKSFLFGVLVTEVFFVILGLIAAA